MYTKSNLFALLCEYYGNVLSQKAGMNLRVGEQRSEFHFLIVWRNDCPVRQK